MPAATARVDCLAIAENLDALSACAADAAVMAVVKADGYGHGATLVARTARAWGAPWLGVAHPAEALTLRAAGDDGRILAWLWVPGDRDVESAVAEGVDLSVSSLEHLADVVRGGERARRTPRVHLKVDTGLSRNGCLPSQWAELVAAVRRAPVEVIGVWSHLANADAGAAGAPSVAAQVAALHAAVEVVRASGLEPQLVHCANTAGVIAHPATHLDLVRLGIGMYGLQAMSDGLMRTPRLRPAMSLVSQVALVKTLPPGAAVGYGSTWTAERATRVGLVPVGYADGLPRSASGRAFVTITNDLGSDTGQRAPIIGRIAMDQCVVDLTDIPGARAGDDVVIFGDPQRGEPSADDLAAAAGTIGYEVVTRVGPRVARTPAGVGQDG